MFCTRATRSILATPEESMPRTTSLTVAAFAAFAACAFAAPVAAQVVTTAGGEVVSPAQKNLVDRLIVSDSIQAATAKLAAEKAQNPAVKDLATQLASDHSSHAAALAKIADKKEVGREANPGDVSGTDLANEFKTLESMPAGPEFDKAYLKAVIADHQAALAAINAGKAAAKDDDLKKDLDATSTALQSHIAHASDVSKSLDKAPTADAAAAKPPMDAAPATKSPMTAGVTKPAPDSAAKPAGAKPPTGKPPIR